MAGIKGKLTDPLLSVVMPVYNEEAGITKVVRDWLHAFTNTGISHRLIAVNDSTAAACSSIQPAAPAAFTIAYSPETL